MNYIVTNFAYGTGPYLRTTELAIAVNNFLEKRGADRCRIIVPIVYGNKQKKIMEEEFKAFYKINPDEIVFDEHLGSYLKSIFYGDGTYEESLRRWISREDEVSSKINAYLGKTYGDRIIMELHRSPRALYSVAPSYFISFAYISQILEESVGNEEIAIDNRLLEEAIPKLRHIEENHKVHFISEPGTFSYKNERKSIFANEFSIPPTIKYPTENNDKSIKEGIFVTVTGIPGLERLYKEALKLGLKIYTNDIIAVPFGERALPHIISNQNIFLQFARSGWSSVWMSQLSGTPILVPEWDKYDDPEIYFNNICIKKLGLGIIYRGQNLKEILEEAELLRPGIERYNQNLYQEFGSLEGTKYVAERIVRDFLSK